MDALVVMRVCFLNTGREAVCLRRGVELKVETLIKIKTIQIVYIFRQRNNDKKQSRERPHSLGFAILSVLLSSSLSSSLSLFLSLSSLFFLKKKKQQRKASIIIIIKLE